MSNQAISHYNIEQGTLLIDIATRNVICLEPDNSIGEAARIMSEKRISSIVVTDSDGHPLGIITEHNMLHAMQSRCPTETELQEVMSSPVITVPLSITCLDAYQICIRDGIRHLVIVSEDKLLFGVVSETDFRQHINLSVLAGRRQVASVMSRSVFTQSPETSLRVALDLMESHKDTCVVAVEAGCPVGIVTERDIVRLYSGNPDRINIPIREVMTSPVLSISLESSINEAAEKMLGAKVRHLVVVDLHGKMAGLLSEHDLTQTMALRLIDDKQISDGAFLHTLVNTIPDMIWLKDVNGVYIACNPRFERFFGAKEKDIIGKTDYDFVDKGLADFFRENDCKAMEKNGPSINEERIFYSDDGHSELLETLKTPMRDRQAKLIGVLGIARDITERKRMEDKLTESESLFRAIFEQAPNAVELIDPDTFRFVEVNPAACQMLGYTNEEYLQLRLIDTQVNFDEYALIKSIQQLEALGGTTFENRHRCKNGDILDVAVNARILDLPGRRLLVGVWRDITEQKRAEIALRESEEKLRNLYELSPLGIALTDMNGRYLEFNESFRRICDYTDEELKALDYWALTPRKYEVDEALQLESLASTGHYGPYEKEYIRKDGNLVSLRLNGVLVTARDGRKCIWSIVEDITKSKSVEEALRENETKYRLLFETAGDGIFLQDVNGFIDCNEKGASMYGLSRAEVLGRSPADLAPEKQPNGRLSAEIADEKIIAVLNGEPQQFDWRTLRSDGVLFDVEITLNRIELGGSVYLQAVVRDITERKLAEENLRITASVFDNSQEAIMINDANNNIIDVNQAFTRITGYSREEVLGRNPKLLSSGRQDKAFYVVMWQSLTRDKIWRGEVWNRRKSGEVYAQQLSISAICDNDGDTVLRYVAVFSDISHIKKHEKQLEHIAYYDPLTRLPNRVLLADRLHQAMTQSQRSGQQLAVVFLDLDGFKNINDNYGHEVGDQLLIAVADRMKQALREGDTIARMGGDEFVAVLLDLEDAEASVPMLTRLLAATAQAVHIGDRLLQVSASLGVTFYPQAEDMDADQLLRQADQAMYQAKLTGKNRYHVFDAALNSNIRSHNKSLNRIRLALTEREFILYYQPKVNMRTGTVIGAEALIRWQHPTKGLLLPSVFLPVIEDHPLAIDIGEWVIDTALAQIELWHAAGLNIPVSVNVGARQLQQPDFVERLRTLLAAHPNIRSGDLEMEILETSALNNIADVSYVIETCRKMGINFALDDFGTGYSSLTYLRRLPVTTLKIDQSFVHDMLDNPDDLAIIEGVISLARTFHRKVIAEGVETVEHGTMLLQLGCELAQGYGIGQPMPASHLHSWLTTWRPDPAWIDQPSMSRDNLPLLFASVEQSSWIAGIEGFLKGERDAPLALDPDHSRFSMWMNMDSLATRSAQPAFETIDSLHRQIQTLSAELCELQILGRNSEALVRLDELHDLRDKLLIHLKVPKQEIHP
jgi:diguanylate cyclase (GGDEF)-like protein/PAS domain S-box-containing protein